MKFVRRLAPLGTALLFLVSLSTVNAEEEPSLTQTFRLEIPNNPNAVPGFTGWGVVTYSPAARGGVHLLASVSTSTPNTAYWLMINPAPIVDGLPQDRTGTYTILELTTDVTGVGHATGFVPLEAGAWELHGVMTADSQLHLSQQYTANTPLCFPDALGPLDILA